MFLGTYRHAVDPKGRVAIPARYREHLPTGTVISRGAEGCLQVYPPQEWAKVEDGMRISATTPAEERQFRRMLFSSARECEFDAQGRIVLSADHRSYAGITQTAVVVGVNNLIEIWNEDAWRRFGDATADEYTRYQDRVAERERRNDR